MYAALAFARANDSQAATTAAAGIDGAAYLDALGHARRWFGAERLAAWGGAPPADDESAWTAPVISTEAQNGAGLDELLEAIDAHRSWLEDAGQLEASRRARARGRVRDVVERELRRTAWASGAVNAILERCLDTLKSETK